MKSKIVFPIFFIFFITTVLRILTPAAPMFAADASDEGLVGVWKWEESYYDEEDEEARSYSLTLTFGVDGVVKIEPFYYDRGADTAYGDYEADGETLRIVVTKVTKKMPFFGGGGSVYFEVGETLVKRYELAEDGLVLHAMLFFGNDMVFRRVK